MTFLAIVIAIILAHSWDGAARVQRDEWFHRWQSALADLGIGAVGRLVLAVGLPVLVAQGLLNALALWFFGLPWIGLAVVLLLYSLGRRDFHQLLANYRSHCRDGDFEGAYLSTLPDLGWTEARDAPVSPEDVHALVQRGFFYEGYQRWFAVLFYFVLLGPVGALAYRLLHLCQHRFEAQLVERCLFLADWVPARLLAAAFGFAGDFVRSRDLLLDGLLDVGVPAQELLYDVGTAALGSAVDFSDERSFGEGAAMQIEETGQLLWRSAACWLVLLSLIVLLD